MQIRAIYISSGHNFFGHNGKAPGEFPMQEREVVECVTGRGIVGDRFFDYKPSYSGQVTFFAHETYERLCRGLSVSDKAASVFRRNVITQGVDLNALIGKEFEIQGVHFRGREECKPCYWMDRAFAPGAEALLKGYGGLRAMILTDGELKKDFQ